MIAFLLFGAALGGAYWWGGLHGLIIAALLSVMEVSLSFDNAVVNAAVLRRMSPRWQRAFLTWGILIAVFGMRLLFPVLIVALATGLGMAQVADMALNEPSQYAAHLTSAHTAIAAFGGMFLLMVFLHFVCDEAKDTHWIGPVERRLSALGRLEAVELGLALALLLAIQAVLPEADQYTALLAGVIGVATYVAVKGLAGLCGENPAACIKAGAGAFLYLEVLDASFSLDGVIGAFAMSNDVVTIMIGLGIGALFVRSLTVWLVRNGTLEEFIYLKHGAHWGIGALAAIMLFSLHTHVSEVVTGLVGVSLIGLALLSSVLHKRRVRE